MRTRESGTGKWEWDWLCGLWMTGDWRQKWGLNLGILMMKQWWHFRFMVHWLWGYFWSSLFVVVSDKGLRRLLDAEVAGGGIVEGPQTSEEEWYCVCALSCQSLNRSRAREGQTNDCSEQETWLRSCCCMTLLSSAQHRRLVDTT